MPGKRNSLGLVPHKERIASTQLVIAQLRENKDLVGFKAAEMA